MRNYFSSILQGFEYDIQVSLILKIKIEQIKSITRAVTHVFVKSKKKQRTPSKFTLKSEFAGGCFVFNQYFQKERRRCREKKKDKMKIR